MPGKDVLYMELNEKNVEPMCPIIDIDVILLMVSNMI